MNFLEWLGLKKVMDDTDPKNVIKFPESKAVPPMPEVKSPEKQATVFYRIGVTDQNRIAFNMGYSEITMNRQGVQNMIDQLTFFMNQLEEEQDA